MMERWKISIEEEKQGIGHFSPRATAKILYCFE